MRRVVGFNQEILLNACTANWVICPSLALSPLLPITLTLGVSCRHILTCVENGESLPSSVVRTGNRRTYCTHPKSPRMKKKGCSSVLSPHLFSSLHTFFTRCIYTVVFIFLSDWTLVRPSDDAFSYCFCSFAPLPDWTLVHT